MKKFLLLSFCLIVLTSLWAQDTLYTCDFDHPSDTAGWVLLGSGQTNHWAIGTINTEVAAGGRLYVTSGYYGTNSYNTSDRCISYAYRQVVLPRGVCRYSYDWRCNGEEFPGADSVDFLRVFLMPDTEVLSAGLFPMGSLTDAGGTLQALPGYCVPIDGGEPLNKVTSWRTMVGEIYVADADTFRLVLMWYNDEHLGGQPPAAVDNLVLVRPECPMPTGLYVDPLTATSFTLHWSDLTEGGATGWLVELDSAGQAYGQGTAYGVNDTLAGFASLTPNTDYRVYVRTVCGSGLGSAYDDTTDAVSLPVYTPCVPLAAVPYVEDFDSVPLSGFADCWRRLLTGGGLSVVDGPEDGRCLRWSTAPRSYRCAVLPGIDSAVSDLGSLQLSFRCMVSNAAARDVEVGVMSNPMDVGTFETVGRVHVDAGSWETYAVEFMNYGGDGGTNRPQVQYAAIRETGSATDDGRGYMLFDDVAIEPAPPCQRVRRLTVGQVGTTGALLEWGLCPGTVNVPDRYEVRVERADASSGPIGTEEPSDSCLRLAVAEPRSLLTGLLPNTAYRAWVRAHCANDSLSGWDTVCFATLSLPCAVGDTATAATVQCGSGTYTSTGVPVSYFYPYSLCQSIYTADTLLAHGGDTGLITGMDYIFTSNPRDMFFSIYVATTPATHYASAADMEEVFASQRVYGPALHAAGTRDTVHCEFDRPFSWNGVGNVVVTTMMNDADTSAPQSPLFYGYSTPTGVNSTVRSHLVDEPFTPDNAASGSAAVSQYRPTVRFHTAQCAGEAECVPPTLWVRQVEPRAAHLEWIPGHGEAGWDVLYRRQGDAGWTVAAHAIDTNYYCLTPLEAYSPYEAKVVPLCGDSTDYARVTFSTLCAPVDSLPLTEDFEHFVASLYGDAPVEPCWHRNRVYPFPYVRTNYAYSGRQSLLMHTDRSTRRCYIATPEMDMAVDGLQVQFFAYDMGYVSNFPLLIGVMTDPDDYSTFVEVARVTNPVPQQWEMHEVPLDAYRGDGRHIALMVQGGEGELDYGLMYVDDLTIGYIPPCQRPRTVTVDRITRTTAVVQWDGRGVRNYEVEYGPAGFVPGTGSVVATMLDSVTLTGLSHSTRYDVYVRGVCDLEPGQVSNSYSERSLVVTFNTLCGEIESLPYVQDFAHLGVGEGTRPPCWECGGRNGYPYVVEADGGVSQGRMFYMPSSPTRAYAILPAVDTVRFPLSSLQVSVKAHSDAEYSISRSHALVVGVCQTEGDMLSFTPFDTVTLTPEPTVYEVPLAGAAGLGRYVTFVSMPVEGAYSNIVYLDSVVIEPLSACQRPYSLTATSPSATTAILTWRCRGTSTLWQVEYMPHGAALGTGTRLFATTPSITLTGLAPATYYDFYVRTICDTTNPGSSSHPSQEGTDTSGWSYAPGYFATQQVPATVPYDYGFSEAGEWDGWQKLSNVEIGWYRGMAAGQPAPGMYVSADSGSTRSTRSHVVVNAVAYRDIDFGTQDTGFVLTFRAAVDGVHTGNLYYDGLAVFLADPATPPLAPTGVATQSPWGQLGDLSLLADISGFHLWTDYSIELDSISGVHRLVFYWYGHTDYEPLLAVTTGQPAAIDNISIQHPPCPRPYSLRATHVTAVSATIRWHGEENADYRVQLYNTAGEILSSDTVHTTHIQYLTLLPGTTYKVRVGRLCDGSEARSSSLYVFSSASCNGGSADTVGDPQSIFASTHVPINICYPYSYTQQLILASELQGRGEITAINFLYASSYPITDKNNCTIYLGHTSLSEFVSTDNFIPSTDLEPVYIGNLNCSQGWNRIVFDSPFPYDGTSNLVIAIDDNSGHRLNGNHYFITAGPTYGNVISFCSIYEDVDCTSASSLNSDLVDRDLYGNRCVMTVEMCPPNDCPQPLLRQPRVRANDVTLRWLSTADRYLFGYRRASNDYWIEDNVPLTDTFYTVDRFAFGEDYVYHVRQFCDTTSVSNWAMGSFNTGDISCLPPFDLYVVDVTNHSVRLSWTPDDNHIGYHLHVWGGGIDTTLTTYIANWAVDGLNPASRYYASVEVQCEYLDEPSEWSDTITFETTVCPDVTGLTALDVQGNSVLLDWDDNEETVSWQIEWGLQGFDQGTGVLVAADHHPFLLTGLTGETVYDIVVRAVCGDDYYSEAWSPRLTLTTSYSGIETDELSTLNSQFSIFPNPTTGDVTLTLPASVGTVRVELVDMEGRQCLKVDSHTPPLSQHPSRTYPGSSSHPSQEGTADASNTQAIKQSNNQAITTTLPTRTLPAGAYYVRLTGDRFSAVRKLLKIEK